MLQQPTVFNIIIYPQLSQIRILSIVVENRRSCCSSRAVTMEVRIKDSDRLVRSCGKIMAVRETYHITCDAIGDTVELTKPFTDSEESLINIAEIYVYGIKLGKPYKRFVTDYCIRVLCKIRKCHKYISLEILYFLL